MHLLPNSPIVNRPETHFKELVMATTTSSPIKTQTRTIDGLSIRYAESAPREVSAILLSPWPESLYTFEQMWPRGRDLQKTKLHNLRTLMEIGTIGAGERPMGHRTDPAIHS